MIYQFVDSSQLPLVGSKGDMAIVDDGNYKRTYSWFAGCWRHSHDYLCPVKSSDLQNEPNV